MRLPTGEHSEIGVDGFRGVHRVVVPPEPTEGATPAPLEPGEVDASRAQSLDVLLAEVVADDADQPHRRVQLRGDREIGRRPAEHVGAMFRRRLHVVIGEGSDDEDVRRHDVGPMSAPTSVRTAKLAATPRAIQSTSVIRSSTGVPGRSCQYALSARCPYRMTAVPAASSIASSAWKIGSLE